jgi:hypothetical protein
LNGRGRRERERTEPHLTSPSPIFSDLSLATLSPAGAAGLVPQGDLSKVWLAITEGGLLG